MLKIEERQCQLESSLSTPVGIELIGVEGETLRERECKGIFFVISRFGGV